MSFQRAVTPTDHTRIQVAKQQKHLTAHDERLLHIENDIHDIKLDVSYLHTTQTQILQKLEAHDACLAALITKQDEHTCTLDEHTRILDEHTCTLDEHTRILDEHTRILNEHSSDLAIIKQTLVEHTIRFDCLEDKMEKGFAELRAAIASLHQLILTRI